MKAILVIDIPQIDKSKINYLSVSFGGVPYYIGRDEMVLRPMPRKLDYRDLKWCNQDNIDGWNACLDEITGETE